MKQIKQANIGYLQMPIIGNIDIALDIFSDGKCKMFVKVKYIDCQIGFLTNRKYRFKDRLKKLIAKSTLKDGDMYDERKGINILIDRMDKLLMGEIKGLYRQIYRDIQSEMIKCHNRGNEINKSLTKLTGIEYGNVGYNK